MPRRPSSKPWYRREKAAWFITIKGRQYRLAKGRENKALAERKLRSLLEQAEKNSLDGYHRTVTRLCDRFLDWVKLNRHPETYDWYRHFLQDFHKRFGRRKAIEVTPDDLNTWTGREEWNSTSRNRAISCVLRAFNFGVRNKLIPYHQLQGMEKPRMKRRTKVLTEAEMTLLLNGTDRHFRDYLEGLRESGARPGELRRLCWPMVDLEKGIAVLDEHKTSHEVDEPRVLVLTERMKELLRKRKSQYPDHEYVFTNKYRKPWTRNAVRLRMQRLRKKLGLDGKVVTYTVRHTYGTDAILKGVDIKTLAALMGHRSISTTQHYTHIARQLDHLKRAAEQATRGASAPAPLERNTPCVA
ncbi:MAG: phage integrase family protein [Planctomycetes bacterium]|nr:phage integrase family protein [Planctomycetota bacterium]